MRVLLIAPRFSVFPVGLSQVSACLQQAGHDVVCRVFDTPQRLTKELEHGYDIVATGGMSMQLDQIETMTATARDAGVRTVVGGNIITSEPELMARELKADYVVIGEGDETAPELLAYLENGGDVSCVAGIGYFVGNQFVQTPKRGQVADLDALPLPDYDGFGLDSFLDGVQPSESPYELYDDPRPYPMVSSRFCPFKCTFCYQSLGRTYRHRSVESMMAELENAVPKYRVNIVTIYDDLFSYNETRLLEFAAQFKRFAAGLSWPLKWSCQLRVDGLDPNVLGVMADSGCMFVSFGFESYSKTVLKSMKKRITPEQIHAALHAVVDHNISLQANFIFGDKAETMETAQETLDFWKEHRECFMNLDFITTLPGSELYQYCVAGGIIPNKLDHIRHHLCEPINMTAMSDRDFWKLRGKVFRYSILYASLAKVDGKMIADGLRLRCPHCQEVTEYRNYTPKSLFYRPALYCRRCRRRFMYVNYLNRALYGVMLVLTYWPTAYRLVVAASRRLSRLERRWCARIG